MEDRTMKKNYIIPNTMFTEMLNTHTYLQAASDPHVNDDGNVEIPGGGEGGDADDGCTKERNAWEEGGLWSFLLILLFFVAPSMSMKAQVSGELESGKTSENIQSVTFVQLNGTTVTYASGTFDSVTYLPGVGLKIYATGSTTSIDYLFCQMSSITYTYSGSTPTPTGNTNANWNIYSDVWTQYNASNTASGATHAQAWRLEYPQINSSSTSVVAVKRTSQYGISLSLEVEGSKRANRWTCFEMHNGLPNNNVGRCASSFSTDTDIPSSYRTTHDEYTDGKYTTTTTNLDGSNTVLFARGHVCASEDRQSSSDQNRHTFITSNIHPQYQAHNGGLWGRMESQLQTWGYSSSFRDTLYVCKGATIADVNLDGTTKTGVITNTEVKNQFGVNITGTLTIPRYWYMAVLCLKNGQYHAMAFWTEQINSSCSSTTLQSCMISIDELEARTGIDFFCNLPDDIETTVEASFDNNFWGVGNSTKERLDDFFELEDEDGDEDAEIALW